MNEKILHIVDGTRLPLAKAGGRLSKLSAGDLGTAVVKGLLARSGIDPSIIDEVIMGCVCQPAEESNLARVISLRSGIPQSVPARTVHRNCASGFEAITQAAEKMAAGRGEIFLVGGVESMSQVPLLFPRTASSKFARLQKARSIGSRISSLCNFRPRDFSPVPALLKGLTDPTCNLGMGQTAEILAREFSISRERQDRFALRSHEHALSGKDRTKTEIIPAYDHVQHAMQEDDGPRPDSSLEKLGRLRPIFDRSRGSVTAGNSSQVTDGAVALLVASEEACKQHHLNSIGRLIDWTYSGCEPQRMGLGPAYALARGRAQGAPELDEVDIIELNEAFAAQALAVMDACKSEKFCHEKLGLSKVLGEMNEEIVNVNGGSIALGHPVGATGARLALTALHELEKRNQKKALVTLCVGGGQGAALWLERN